MSYGFDDGLPVEPEPATAPLPIVDTPDEVSLIERVDELENLYDGLMTVLETVQTQVETLATGAPAPVASSASDDDDDRGEDESEYAAYCWRYASPAQKKRLWVQLREWVDWANTTLCSNKWQHIRPCWFRHPAAVEELTALWAAWEAAYRTGDAEFTDAAAYFHDRFHTVVHRLWDGEFSECIRGHQEPEFDPNLRLTGEDFDQFIQQH